VSRAGGLGPRAARLAFATMSQPDSSPAPAGAPRRGQSWPAVSVVVPVREEGRHLGEAVRRILSQDYPGALEVVLSVAPSRDATEQVARDLAAHEPRITIVANLSGRTPSALNAALGVARHEVVARVDGHAVLPPDYLRVAVRALQEHGADNVGGVMAAEGVSDFEKAVARAMTTRLGVGGARFHTGGTAGPADTVYLGVFRRAALRRVGGYDERFSRAQDWDLNFRIRETGGTVWFTPDLQVSYRPRSTLAALASQYFDYGTWRRAVGRRHAGTLNVRYLAPPAAVLAVLAGTVLGLSGRRVGYLVPTTYAAGILAGSVVNGRGLSWRPRAWLPLTYATMHGAWGTGFLLSRERVEGRPVDLASPAVEAQR